MKSAQHRVVKNRPLQATSRRLVQLNDNASNNAKQPTAPAASLVPSSFKKRRTGYAVGMEPTTTQQ